jgi:hypothetical protein
MEIAERAPDRAERVISDMKIAERASDRAERVMLETSVVEYARVKELNA